MGSLNFWVTKVQKMFCFCPKMEKHKPNSCCLAMDQNHSLISRLAKVDIDELHVSMLFIQVFCVVLSKTNHSANAKWKVGTVLQSLATYLFDLICLDPSRGPY